MQNEEETPKLEMVLARKMALTAIMGESLDNVLLDCPSYLKQTVYAIALSTCAQMNENEALYRIKDKCPPDLLAGIIYEAMDTFANKEHYNIFKRIKEACSTELLKIVLSMAIIEYAEYNTKSALRIIKALDFSNLLKNAFSQVLVDNAENKIALNRVMTICPKNIKEEALKLAITDCRKEKNINSLKILTHQLSMVKFYQMIIPIQKPENNLKGESRNQNSNKNCSKKRIRTQKRIQDYIKYLNYFICLFLLFLSGQM